MNPLLSYIRHLVTYAVTRIFVITNLPQEGASQAATYIAEAVVIALSWVVVKYGGSWLKKVGILHLMLIGCCLSTISCGVLQLPEQVKGSLFYRDANSGAKAGLELKDGKLKPWAKVPFIDENGNVIGEFEVESAK